MLILLKSNGITWDFIKCFLLMLSFQGKTGDFYSDKVEKMYFLLLVSSVLWIIPKSSTSSSPYYTLFRKLLVNPGKTSAFSSSFFML